jgi:hypothetical protein
VEAVWLFSVVLIASAGNKESRKGGKEGIKEGRNQVRKE